MMGGDEGNNDVADYIWGSLVNENDAVDNVMETAERIQHPILILDPGCLSEEERAHREQQVINTEVSRRITMEHQNA